MCKVLFIQAADQVQAIDGDILDGARQVVGNVADFFRLAGRQLDLPEFASRALADTGLAGFPGRAGGFKEPGVSIPFAQFHDAEPVGKKLDGPASRLNRNQVAGVMLGSCQDAAIGQLPEHPEIAQAGAVFKLRELPYFPTRVFVLKRPYRVDQGFFGTPRLCVHIHRLFDV